MDVVRDLLDKSVVDRNGREMGRVDAVLLEQETGEPPRLAAILIGPAALGSRLHPVLGRFVTAVERRLGFDQNRPERIDIADVDAIDHKIRVRLTVGETGLHAVEQRVRGWLSRVPGSQ